jgi:hypothetical protein
MSSSGAASFPIPPVLTRFPFVTPQFMLTPAAFSFLNEVWAAIQAPGGLVPNLTTLEAAVLQLQDMSGDGTFSTVTGKITVTKTNGVNFGYFATGTDASHLTGTIHFAQLPAPLNSETANTLLGRGGSTGTPEEITIGQGLTVTGTTLITEESEVSAVSALPTQPYRAGARRFANDASATTFASIVAGGGANFVPVYSDGTNWRIG